MTDTILYEIFTILFVTAVVTAMTLYFQKKREKDDNNLM